MEKLAQIIQRLVFNMMFCCFSIFCVASRQYFSQFEVHLLCCDVLQEKGDLKLRVRTLESERAFQRVAAVQRTIGNVSLQIHAEKPLPKSCYTIQYFQTEKLTNHIKLYQIEISILKYNNTKFIKMKIIPSDNLPLNNLASEKGL